MYKVELDSHSYGDCNWEFVWYFNTKEEAIALENVIKSLGFNHLTVLSISGNIQAPYYPSDSVYLRVHECIPTTQSLKEIESSLSDYLN